MPGPPPGPPIMPGPPPGPPIMPGPPPGPPPGNSPPPRRPPPRPSGESSLERLRRPSRRPPPPSPRPSDCSAPGRCAHAGTEYASKKRPIIRPKNSRKAFRSTMPSTHYNRVCRPRKRPVRVHYLLTLRDGPPIASAFRGKVPAFRLHGKWQPRRRTLPPCRPLGGYCAGQYALHAKGLCS